MDNKILKKIKFSLNLGILGHDDSDKNLFINYLKKIALTSDALKDENEFLILYEDIPLKIHVFNAESFKSFINNSDKIIRIDVLLVLIDIYNPNALDIMLFKDLEEFKAIYIFKGVSILVGVDRLSIEGILPLDKWRISRINLIQETKNLEFLYCFEVQNSDYDIAEIYRKIFNNFLLKLKNSNLELLKQAKNYGEKLKDQFNY